MTSSFSMKQEARSGVVETGHWRTLWACHSFIGGPERKLCAPPGHQCSASEASQLWHHEKGNFSNSMAAWPYLCRLRLCHCFTFFSLCGPLQRTLSPPLPSLNSPTSPPAIQNWKTKKVMTSCQRLLSLSGAYLCSVGSIIYKECPALNTDFTSVSGVSALHTHSIASHTG